MKSSYWLLAWTIVLFHCVWHASSSSGQSETNFVPTLCLKWSSPAPKHSSGSYNLNNSCVGGDAGLLTTGTWLNYNINFSIPGNNPQVYMNRTWIEYNSTAPPLTLHGGDSQQLNITGVEYTFEQPEHGGGKCHCLQVFFNESCEDASGLSYGKLCDGNARIPRTLKVIWTPDDGYSIEESKNISEPKQLPFRANCTRSQTQLFISYTVFTSDQEPCDPIDIFDEGIELAIKLTSRDEWIPVIYSYASKSDNNETNEYIRGYKVVKIEELHKNKLANLSINLCDIALTETIQFRWLQSTGAILGRIDHARDVWSLDNVHIYVQSNNTRCYLLWDSFENVTQSYQNWGNNSIRNGNITNYCSNDSEALVFGGNSIDQGREYWNYGSRALLSKPQSLCELSCISDNLNECPRASVTSSVQDLTVSVSTAAMTTMGIQSTAASDETSTSVHEASSKLYTSMYPNTTSKYLSSSTPEAHITPTSTDIDIQQLSTVMDISTSSSQILSPSPTWSTVLPSFSSSPMVTTSSATMSPSKNIESEVSDNLSDQQATERLNSLALYLIYGDQDLWEIYTTSNSIRRLNLLRDISMRHEKSVVAVTYLLSDTLAAVNRNNSYNDFIKIVLQIGNAIIEDSGNTSLSKTEATIIGTTLLLAIDQAAATLTHHEVHITSNIVLDIEKSNKETTREEFTSIDSSSLGWQPPHSSINVPEKELDKFAVDGVLTTLATTFRNVGALFPPGRQKYQGDELVSDVIGTSIQCGLQPCNTSNLSLPSPVTIKFEHSAKLQEKLLNSSTETHCVFLDVPKLNRSIFHLGYWSEKGCLKNYDLSSNKKTTCECDHLTHFAILLSSTTLDFNPKVTLSLTIIGYVGVAISVVAMALTVLSFVALRSLHTMRNFITINLCVTLSIAQILFVAGVDKTGETDQDVPIHCQVIAVLLHYFFLVTFMWMLMQGVFLYLTLVRVFVSKTKNYLVAFMAVCYGLPLIYMGLLTLPLGFGLTNGPHYGYEKVCFLRPDNFFIWALIAPVVLIFLANIGFFIMAGVIMWRHQMKLKDKSKFQNVCSWLRSALSLVVIMGLTWIMGLVIVDVDKLAPLAYIYTILVAFQGLFIFLMFVVFSKVVRQAYMKWLKTRINRSELLSRHFGDTKTIIKSRSSTTKQTTMRMTNGSDFIRNSTGRYSGAPTASVRLSTISGTETEKESAPAISPEKVDYSLVVGSSMSEELDPGSRLGESVNSCDSQNILI